MYTLLVSKRFRKQVRKLKKANPLLLTKLETTVEALRQGKSLPISQRDHALTGSLHLFRECHIAPDWLLIYRVHHGILVLELFSTGTHARFFE